MNPKLRGALFLICAAVLAVGAVHTLLELQPVGTYDRKEADAIVRSTQSDRHGANAVGAVTFDYRGFDTLGEEFILFGTTMGVTILLREQRRAADEEERRQHAEEISAELRQVSPAVRRLGALFVTPTLLFGLYIAAHGHLTPGGGFQAGAILASGVALIFLTARQLSTGRVEPGTALEAFEGIPLAAFAAVGLVGLIVSGAFLANFLPVGTQGQLLSAGTIPVLSVIAGFAVGAGITLIAAELLEKRVLRSGRGET